MLPAHNINYDEIIDFLKTFATRQSKHAFLLAKYKKQAVALVKVNASAGYSALGAIACIEHNLDQMHSYHKTAIGNFPSVFAYENYIASLECACLWGDAADYAEISHAFDPSDTEPLKTLIGVLPLSGRFSALEDALHDWRKLNGGKEHATHEKMVRIREFLLQNNIDEDSLGLLLSSVGNALCSTDICMGEFNVDLVDDEKQLGYELFIQKDDVPYYQALVATAIEEANLPVKDFVSFTLKDIAEENASAHLFSFIEDGGASALVSPNLDELKLIEELIDGVEL